MRDVQLEFVFTKCYKEATDEQRAGLKLNEAFLEQVELLKEQYNGNTDNLVLCHGDLHPGSVMVTDTQVRIIDPEFTVYGPPGLDVGSLLSGYCLGAIHQAASGNMAAATALVTSVRDIWSSYCLTMTADKFPIEAIGIETVGFTVAEVCRTALGFAGGRKWLQFPDQPATQAAAQKIALELVDSCMVARHGGGMELLIQQLEVAVDKAQGIAKA